MTSKSQSKSKISQSKSKSVTAATADKTGNQQSADAISQGIQFMAADMVVLNQELEGLTNHKVHQNKKSTGSSIHDHEIEYILGLLQISVFEGNLCLSSNQDDMKRLQMQTEYNPAQPLSAKRVCEIIADDQIEDRLSSFFKHRTLVRHLQNGCYFLYPGRYFRAIEQIRQYALQATPADLTAPDKDNQEVQSWFDDILVKRPIRAGTKPIECTFEQKLALLLALDQPVFVLSGGPGTGKTTIIVNVLRLLCRSGIAVEKIRLAAPTGKAAARMTEAINLGLSSIDQPTTVDTDIAKIQASTLHRLLGIRPGSAGPDFDANQPIDADLIIVDEVSMVDITMMSFLLQAINRAKTKLILIGDRDQLPSVESGAVLSDLLFLLSDDGDASFSQSFIDRAKVILGNDIQDAIHSVHPDSPNRYIHLTRSHRSEKGIRELALWVNANKKQKNPITKTDRSKLGSFEEGAFLVERTSADRSSFESLLQRWTDFAYPAEWNELLGKLRNAAAPNDFQSLDLADQDTLRRLFTIFETNRILTVLRRGPFGAESVQRIIERQMKLRDHRHRGTLFSGFPILMKQNDPLRELSNGDTGLLIEFRNHRFLAAIPRLLTKSATFSELAFVFFTPDVLPQYDPAYAMTIHKSQGSEYQNVLIVLPNEVEHPLMTRQIIYTGITRAKKVVYIDGTMEQIEAAANTAIKRITGRPD